MSPTHQAPVLSLTHGGGPMPLLNDPKQADITNSLRTRVASELEAAKPAAIVLVTAHWEAEITTVTTSQRPELYYDYYGFPEEAYAFKYPAPGAPDVAMRTIELLKSKGLEVKKDDQRGMGLFPYHFRDKTRTILISEGWDHGVFVPMLLARPQADIPIVQISVLSSQDPADLFALGQALRPLRKENIAIIGSGSASFHNIRHFFSDLANDGGFVDQHKKWREVLDSAVTSPDTNTRGEELKGWKEWSGSDVMHPRGRSEHFSPLIVCAGAAGDLNEHQKVEGWKDVMAGFEMQNWIWKDIRSR